MLLPILLELGMYRLSAFAPHDVVHSRLFLFILAVLYVFPLLRVFIAPHYYQCYRSLQVARTTRLAHYDHSQSSKWCASSGLLSVNGPVHSNDAHSVQMMRSERASADELSQLFTHTIPGMIRLARRLPDVFPYSPVDDVDHRIPLIRSREDAQVSMSQVLLC